MTSPEPAPAVTPLHDGEPWPAIHSQPSDYLPNVHQCLTMAMEIITPVGKEGVNQERGGGYRFKRIDDFLTAANDAMSQAGVHVVPKVLQRITDETHLTSNQNVMRWVDLEVEFTFYGPRGDSVVAVTWGEGRDASDKATNKALTAAMKYALMYSLMVPTSDIQDADQTSPESGTAQEPTGQPRAQPPVNSEVVQLQQQILAVGERKHLSKEEVIAEFDVWKEARGMAVVATIGNSNAVTLQAFVAHLLAEKPPAQTPGQEALPGTGAPDEVAEGQPVESGPPSDHPEPAADDVEDRLVRARERNAKHQ